MPVRFLGTVGRRVWGFDSWVDVPVSSYISLHVKQSLEPAAEVSVGEWLDVNGG